MECVENAVERAVRDKSDLLRYRDSQGEQIDFHAIRHSYLPRLGRAGVSARVMQRLARHSTVELTINCYTHADMDDLASAVNRLPTLPTFDSPHVRHRHDRSRCRVLGCTFGCTLC